MIACRGSDEGMTALRARRSADRAQSRAGVAIPQLPPRAVRNPYPPMQLLSADQVEAIHEASLHILENFGIEVISSRALALFERAGASVDHASQTVKLDRGLVSAALKSVQSAFTLQSRNPERNVPLGGNAINFTLVAGPPNVHDMERGRRAGNLGDYHDLVRLAQHFNCITMLGNQVCAPVELPANSRHLDTYSANLTLTDKAFHVSAIGRGQGARRHCDDGHFARTDIGSDRRSAGRHDHHFRQFAAPARRCDDRWADDDGRARSVGVHHTVHADGCDEPGDAGRRAGAAECRGAVRYRAGGNWCGPAHR